MKKQMLVLLAVVSLLSMTVSADTVAYWRFEEGPADAKVVHPVGGVAGLLGFQNHDAAADSVHHAMWHVEEVPFMH